jgi:hypothetical protein
VGLWVGWCRGGGCGFAGWGMGGGFFGGVSGGWWGS